MARAFLNTTANFLHIGDVTAIDITGTALTVCCWYYAFALGGGVDQDLVSKSRFSATVLQYHLCIGGTANQVQFQIGDGTGFDGAEAGTAITTGVWNHIGGVKNGTGAGALKTYLNGAEQASTTSNKSISHIAESLRIAKRNEDANNHPPNGYIAEVAIWNVALSAGEIKVLASNYSPKDTRPSGLQGYWPITGFDSPEKDLSGNGNSATVNGTPPQAEHVYVIGPPVRLGVAGVG